MNPTDKVVVSEQQADQPTFQRPVRDAMPKVAYLMSRFPKITETFILYEILEQQRLGGRIEVYPLLRESQPVEHPEAGAIVNRAHYMPFISWPIVRANLHFLLRRPRAYLRMLAEVLGGTFGSANFLIGAIGILPKAVRFAYEMEGQGIAHVHAHFANHPAVAALIVHRLTGIPFSFTAHGSDLHVERRMLDRKVRAATFVVTISDYNKNMIVQECGEGAREKIHVIHCGVDPESLIPQPRNHRDGLFRILSIGSLEEVKGHTYLIEACHLLAQRGVNFCCHIVGEGALRPKLQSQIDRAGLGVKVFLHGALPRPEVIQMFADVDVVVQPSVQTRQGKREGIPVSVTEGMACGLPVVASAISGIPELVEHGVSGFLVPPRNPPVLAEALERLSRDADLRARFGEAGREKVIQEFNLRTNTARLAELIFTNRSGQAFSLGREAALDATQLLEG